MAKDAADEAMEKKEAMKANQKKAMAKEADDHGHGHGHGHDHDHDDRPADVIEEERKKEAARARLISQSVEILIWELDRYKLLVQELRKNMHTRDRASKKELSNLPLIYIANSVQNVFAFDTSYDRDFRDPLQVTRECTNVTNMMKKFDDDPRIEGQFWYLTRNHEKCKRLTDLLILRKISPNRGEIFAVEKDVSGSWSNEEGSLRYQATLGRTTQLCSAIELFLESMRPLETRDNLVDALKATINSVWYEVDVDKSGELSSNETRELFRHLLSRPSMGSLIIDFVCVEPSNSMWATTDHAKSTLTTLVPEALLNFAIGAKKVANDLWSAMDENGDGLVEQHEFCDHFPRAFKQVILLPLVKHITALGQSIIAPAQGSVVVTTQINTKRVSIAGVRDSFSSSTLNCVPGFAKIAIPGQFDCSERQDSVAKPATIIGGTIIDDEAGELTSTNRQGSKGRADACSRACSRDQTCGLKKCW